MKIIFLGLILALAIADAGRLLNPCKQPGFFAHVDNTSAFYGCYLNEDGNLDVKYLTCATGHLFKRTAGYCVPKTTFAIEARAVTDSNNDVENPTEPTTTTKGDIIKPTIPTTAATGSTINGNTKVDNNDDGETTEGSTEATTTVETTEATEQPETTENSTETTEEPATTDETTVVSTEEPATTEETTETTDEPATTASTTETTEEPTTTASTTEEPTTTDEPTTTASSTETTEEPTTTASPTETTEEPATTESSTEEPTTTGSSTETTEEPATTASSTEEPATAGSSTEEPATTGSSTGSTEESSTTSGSVSTTEPESTTLPAFDCPDEGFFSQSGSCDKFAYCANVNGEIKYYLLSCPTGQQFNYYESFCDANFDCADATRSVSRNSARRRFNIFRLLNHF